jgi:archaeosine-15-forming tRNA-guanine transglycosylase
MSGVALVIEDDDEETRFHVGRTGGQYTDFNADDAVFLTDDRLLLLDRPSGSRVRLREIDVRDPTRVVVQHELDGVVSTALTYDSDAREWVLLGRSATRSNSDIVRVSGRSGDAAVKERRWAMRDTSLRGTPVTSAIDGALVSDLDYGQIGTARSVFVAWTAVLGGYTAAQSRLWTIGDRGASLRLTTHLELQCAAAHMADADVVCGAFDGSRTRMFVMNDRAEHVRVVGWLPGRFYFQGSSSGAWLPGWSRSDLVVLRLDGREALRFTDASGARIRHVAVSDSVVAAVAARDGRATLTVYARESPES